MSDNFREVLLSKITQRTARVAVLGLGYVGLPLVAAFSEAGFNVIGIDPDKRKVDTVRRGESHIQDVPDEQVARLVAAGRLTATTDFAALKEADAVSICVPTPLRKTGDPDLSFILNATEELAKYMHPGMVVVLESTTYPGTTREILLPKLGAEKGLAVGENFFLAFSPERVDPGRKDWTTINTPKVIGGITPACGEVASTWYAQALECVIPVSSAETAEMTKLLENTFRMINIGLVNEMALMCDRLGIDVWEVIEAAASKPFGFMKFTPGPGLGGHCIPIDPLYLSWKLKALNYTARFIEVADQVNISMPHHVVTLIQNALNDEGKALKGAKVLVLGAAYKKDIDDLRESPALDVMVTLLAHQADVSYHDPYVPVVRLDGDTLHSMPLSPETLAGADCVVVITDHSAFDWEMIGRHARLIVDTRNAMKAASNGRARVVKL